jgi:xylitol oxidase
MADQPRNWAGNIAFSAGRIERPASTEELQAVVRRADRTRVLGSGHSFNRIADTDGILVSLSGLSGIRKIDHAARTVTIEGGTTYAQLLPALHEAGYALENLASLPHITVAGAISTATHGSGNGNRNLAAAVAGLELVTADGEIIHRQRGEADFDGMVVGLGALGVVSALTLDIVPTFDIHQTVYLDLPLETLLANFDAVTAAAYSVSLFTRWQDDHIDQVWLKALATTGKPAETLFGAHAADAPRHPLPGMDAGNCTPQMGVAGPWHERLLHFPIGFLASAGAELQSEYFVPRPVATQAILALHKAQQLFASALYASEIRTIAADDLWLSTAEGQDMVGFHFTWKPEWDRALQAVHCVEDALAPFAPRPHWAKVFTVPGADIRARYPRLADFVALADRLDPTGKFRNGFLDDVIYG